MLFKNGDEVIKIKEEMGSRLPMGTTGIILKVFDDGKELKIQLDEDLLKSIGVQGDYMYSKATQWEIVNKYNLIKEGDNIV